jgi:hypothetical protein
MNQNIHRINDIIKQVPDLRYDASTGWFETDRRALYDFAVLVVKECANKLRETDYELVFAEDGMCDPSISDAMLVAASDIEEHFGVE